MLSVAFAYFITLIFDIDLAWSFLIVFAVYLLVAAGLIAIGVKKVKQVKAPEKTIEQAKEIPSAFKRSS